MSDSTRAELENLGLSPLDVVLPGEGGGFPLDGALVIEPAADEWMLATVDYGTHWPLATAPDELGAHAALLQYVSRPLPAVRPIPAAELDELASGVAVHYVDIRARAQAAGSGGIVMDIPPGIPLDRIGALDGVHLSPLDTPFEQRSLPPTSLMPQTVVRRFVSRGTFRVGAVITPPWFGQRGGGIRFTIQEPRVGIRDLVVAGLLEQVVRS